MSQLDSGQQEPIRKPDSLSQLKTAINDKKEAKEIAASYDYDVALSFAGEDRIQADALAEVLRHQGVKVFYDQYEKANLWGKNLYTCLSDIYQNKARYCIIFLSKHYAAKLWTNHERESAQARAFKENEEYILPIRLDNTEIPGILKTTAYLSWHQETLDSIVKTVLEKLGMVPQKSYIDETKVMDWLVGEAHVINGKVSVDIGDIPGVKHSVRMTKDNEDWGAWYGMWFKQEFAERIGFEPTDESVRYALDKYAELSE